MNSDRLKKLLEFYENEPNDAFLKYALATEYLTLNDTSTALSYFEDLVQNHKNYVGTYYHFGKLLEGLNRKDEAVKVYQQGIQVAREIKDNHALSELQTVYNSAIGLNYEDD